MKGVGRIYQQTFIDTYAKVAFAKLYDRKTPITAADLINDRVVPFYDAHEVKLCRVLTDRGTEYCGNPEHHEYELYLALEDIDHSRTKTKSPQTNGIVERFHKTALDEFYRVAFRKKIYGSISELQSDLDDWVICGRPLGKRFYFCGERLAAFGHMSGLLARTGSAGPDEVRRPSAPDQGGELWAPDPLRSVRWSSIVSPCRSSRRRRARQTLEPAFSFRVRCPGLA